MFKHLSSWQETQFSFCFFFFKMALLIYSQMHTSWHRGPSIGDGELKIAIFLHKRWDCKALYYHLSFWQNETLTNTAGFGDQRWGTDWFSDHCFSDTSGLDWSRGSNNINVKLTFWNPSTLMRGCYFSAWGGGCATMVLYVCLFCCFVDHLLPAKVNSSL